MDSSVTLGSGTAVLCEAMVFIDYKGQLDRILIAQSRKIADHLVAAAARALRRSGRSVGPAMHASTGVLLEEDYYQVAWERPARQRTGNPPMAHPPFFTHPRFATGGSTMADWRGLSKRVVHHDADPAPEAARLAREMGANELLVVVLRGHRRPMREQLEAGWNPLAGMFDDERVGWPESGAALELALYEGREGRRIWAFSDELTAWNTMPQRLGDWTLAALKLMPSPGVQGGHDDITTPGFRAPNRNDVVLRLGEVDVADHGGFFLGTRATYLFRPWISTGFQLDVQSIRASRFVLGGSGALAGPYQRELHEADVDMFPLYAVLEFHLPRVARALPTVGVSGGYAMAFLRAQGYETQLFGDFGWAVHGNLRWPMRHVAIGFEGFVQRVQPQRDGTDPVTQEPVRERLDLDGRGFSLALTVWM